MRRECPELAVSTQIASPERLMGQVQDGSLDVAVLYAAPRRPGMIAELLFEEKLVLVRTTDRELGPDDYVHVDWGDAFTANEHAAFPELANPIVSISYGPLALDYILAVGGSGYFRMGIVRPYLEKGVLALVPNNPELSYPAYAVHSTKADEGIITQIRTGLRNAAAIST
jgi:DNA-binding transcriptional LysR family regulator